MTRNHFNNRQVVSISFHKNAMLHQLSTVNSTRQLFLFKAWSVNGHFWTFSITSFFFILVLIFNGAIHPKMFEVLWDPYHGELQQMSRTNQISAIWMDIHSRGNISDPLRARELGRPIGKTSIEILTSTKHVWWNRASTMNVLKYLAEKKKVGWGYRPAG